MSTPAPKVDASSLFKTNGPEEAKRHLAETKKHIARLRSFLDELEQAIAERKPRTVIQGEWLNLIERETSGIIYTAAMANGALMVRGTETEQGV
ncbi:MAG: hypothetical protein AAB447_03030 [Patescibacteria group bacterium]